MAKKFLNVDIQAVNEKHKRKTYIKIYIMKRIPRKLKKKYKKIWTERLQKKITIVKASIEKEYRTCGKIHLAPEDENNYFKVWGCIVKHK